MNRFLRALEVFLYLVSATVFIDVWYGRVFGYLITDVALAIFATWLVSFIAAVILALANVTPKWRYPLISAVFAWVVRVMSLGLDFFGYYGMGDFLFHTLIHIIQLLIAFLGVLLGIAIRRLWFIIRSKYSHKHK